MFRVRLWIYKRELQIPNSLSPDYKSGAAEHFFMEISADKSSFIGGTYELLYIYS